MKDWKKIETDLIQLRQELHRFPELSGHEFETAQRIAAFAEKYSPGKVLRDLGGTGLAVIFESHVPGPVVLIRCDMDALPIQEENLFEYQSTRQLVSHKCGHDGHMAIVAGLIPALAETKIKKGKVVLLFQPAEETGEGAFRVISDTRFASVIPDYVFALHNLPGFPLHDIVVKDNEFASASQGLIVRLKGKSSHAAEPEKGVTPTLAVTELIHELLAIPHQPFLRDFSLVTIVHTRIGERAFGTTPGNAEVMATIRSYNNRDMRSMTNYAEKLASKIAAKHQLKHEIEWVEKFPATKNYKSCVRLIRQCAGELQLHLHEIEHPFRWSEDFGHFTQNFRGALFGVGAGQAHPQLHHPDYDFPDEIIITGTRMFYSLIQKLTA
ncbi:MAG: amidohydrolase [Lentimicrobiaceae bacterium]|nr:amidohydrolase [Lentimicrobiaceae bacterium]MCB9024362.1 amidohydrolase [Lentimicrobiaceae bacterium]MCO5264673.1 amidohydrolase [Lentimicrobium sp.]